MSRAALKPIDLNHHFHYCQQLRAVSYLASFGSMAGFERDYGENYRQRLQQKIDLLPAANCHLWLGDVIIGQTEAKPLADPEVGYINLLVVTPAYQRQGYGQLMLNHLTELYRSQNKQRLQLSVSPLNASALAFYQRTGWQSLGARPDNPAMRLLQKHIGN